MQRCAEETIRVAWRLARALGNAEADPRRTVALEDARTDWAQGREGPHPTAAARPPLRALLSSLLRTSGPSGT
jgi:hypothetical protein